MLDEGIIKRGFIDACNQVMNDLSDDRDGALDKVMSGFARVVADAIKSATVTAPNGVCSIQ